MEVGYVPLSLRGVYLSPPEDLRRNWKVQRDCSRRGHMTNEVLAELDRREGDTEVYIRPQQRHAEFVISVTAGEAGDQDHLDAKVVMRPGLPHPDLTPFADLAGDGFAAWRCRSSRGRDEPPRPRRLAQRFTRERDELLDRLAHGAYGGAQQEPGPG